jgi:hypothetical protein
MYFTTGCPLIDEKSRLEEGTTGLNDVARILAQPEVSKATNTKERKKLMKTEIEL